MVKSVAKTIRIPESLFNLIMGCNQGKTFTEVVRDLLAREYSFRTYCIQGTTPSPLSVVDPNLTIEEEIDQFLSCIQRKKKDGDIF